MLKILLCNPYVITKQNIRCWPDEPLGLLYLASYANRENEKYLFDINIQILDAHLEGKETCTKTTDGYRSGLDDLEFQEKLVQYEPNIVGITNNYTMSVANVIEICKLAKKICPKCLVVIGGAHATIAHKNLIEYPEIDIVARGEGEVIFWEIIRAVYENKELRNVKGIVYKENGEICRNPDMPLITNIDTLPIPDRSLVSYKEYSYSKGYSCIPMNIPIGNIFSSRGCPFKCVFCSTQKVWTNKWRARSAHNIMQEIEYLHTSYGVKEIIFQDDQFMGRKERVIELCNIIIKKKLKLSFALPTGVSPALVDENIIDLLSRAGFYQIRFSVDVGTERARKFVQKPVNLNKVAGLISRANFKGLWTSATFVIGYPHETEQDILETIKYAYSLPADNIIWYIAQPHIGSRLYDIFLEEGMFNEKDKYYSFRDSIYGTKHISADQLIDLTKSAERGYLKIYIRRLLNPIYFFSQFLPKIFSPKKITYFMRLIRILW